MRRRVRRVGITTCLVGALLAGAASAALAATPLTGTTIGNAGLPNGSFLCESSTVSARITASGTYAGSGTETYEYRTSLAPGASGTGTVLEFTASFRFATADGTVVEGTKVLDPRGTSTATCQREPGRVRATASIAATYTATITTRDGLSSTDRGTSRMEVRIDSRGFSFQFTETFTSNRAPDCSGVVASPSRLDAPAVRTRFAAVRLSGATDPDGDALTYRVDGVTQDEAVTGVGIGDPTEPDARRGSSGDTVLLRNERNPQGNGRVYRIAYTVSDGTDTCSGVVTVGVARRAGQSAVDDGATSAYDSFTGRRVR